MTMSKQTDTTGPSFGFAYILFDFGYMKMI